MIYVLMHKSSLSFLLLLKPKLVVLLSSILPIITTKA